MTVAERGPPPRTKRQDGEAAERGCGTGHTTVPKGSTRRARPNGGTTGGATAGRKGDDGSHTASPPHLQRDKCRAMYLHPARDVLTPEDRQRGCPPPQTPSPPPTQERGEDSEETARGHGGGRGQTKTPGGETSGERWRC